MSKERSLIYAAIGMLSCLLGKDPPVWSITKRSTHVPKVTLTLCIIRSLMFISSVPQDEISEFCLSLLFDVLDNGWLFLCLPPERDFKNICMWSFCYVVFAVGLLSFSLPTGFFHMLFFFYAHCLSYFPAKLARKAKLMEAYTVPLPVLP